MSLDSCIRSARQYVKDNEDVRFSDKELLQVGQMLQKAEEMGATPAQKNAMMARMVEQKLSNDLAVERAVKLRNAITNEKGVAQVLRNGESWVKEGETGQKLGERTADAFQAHIQGGSSRAGIGTNMDPHLMKGAAKADYLSFVNNVLSAADRKILRALPIESDVSKNIFLELGALRKGTALGQTGDETALRLAKSLRKIQDYTLHDMKGLNPYFHENEDFLLSRIHDRDKMVAVSKETWVKEAMGRFSGSFLGMDDAEKVQAFGAIYDAKKNGSYKPSEMQYNEWAPRGTLKDQGLAAAPKRVLVANSPLDEWKYASKFGQDIWPTLMQGIEDRAQTVATVQKWGLNSGRNYKLQYGKILLSLSKSDPEAAAAFERRAPEFDKMFAATQVRRSNEAFSWQGRAAQNLMAAKNLSLLGMHVPLSLNGFATALTIARDSFGKSLPENAFELAKHMTGHFLTGNGGRDVGMALGLEFRSYSNDLMGNLGVEGGTQPGVGAKLAEGVGKATMTDRWVSSQKATVARFLSREMASRADVPFDKLTLKQQDELGRYNLHGEAWNVLRQAVAKDGPMKGLITPEAIKALSDEQTKPLVRDGASKAEHQAARTQLALGFSTLLSDEGGRAASESNTRSRYTAYGDTQIDDKDFWGIGRRFMMQFKQATLIQQQSFARTLRSGGGNSSNISGVLQHAVAASFMGFLGQAIIDEMTGKNTTPREMVGRTAINAVGAGVIGDVLIHALERSTPKDAVLDASEGLIGPVPGMILQGAAAGAKTAGGIHDYMKGKETKDQFAGREWARVIHGMVPGQNIFWTKAAIDYMLMNELHEFMGGGGYLESLRRGVTKNPGWIEQMGAEHSPLYDSYGQSSRKNYWE